MFIWRHVPIFTLVVIIATNVNCFRIKRNASGDDFYLKSIKNLYTKLINHIEKSEVIRHNDFLSIETISNQTDQAREGARFLDKLDDIANTKSSNANLGLVDLKLFRDGGEFNVDVKLHPRKYKGNEGDSMLLPILIGLKATTFIFGVVSLVGLFTLKAFIASKTAILIAVILGLKKLFGENHKTSYEAIHDDYSIPEYHQYANFHYEPETFKGYSEIPDHKLVEIYELTKDHSELSHENKDIPKYEFREQEASPETLKGQEFYGLFGSNLQELNHEIHRRRRSW